MSEKNTPGQNTLIIAAIIGALGGILAACIGLLPTILPMVRPSPTFQPFVTDTATPSDTPSPDTPTATATDFPTLTATLTPQIEDTPTMTFTPNAQTTNMEAYAGTWLNVDSEPASDKVRLIPTRLEVDKTGDTTANISVCRSTEDGERYVQPHPASATMYAFGVAARDLMAPAFENLRWAIIVQRVEDRLVLTVQEYDTNNTLLNSDTFQMEKASFLNPGAMLPCEEPQISQ